MTRLASFLSFLALLVGIAGAAAFYLVYRPSGLPEWTAAGLDFAALALADVWAPAAAAAAVAASVAARLLDRPPAVERSRRVHELPRAPADTAREPKSALSTELEKLRLRLRAALRARGDDVTEFVDELLAGALACRASDVHLQPREGFARVSLRIEGELVEVAAAEEDRHARIVRRIKVLAQLVSFKSHEPQDGRFSLRTDSSAVDVRVSIVPAQHGEKVALRFLKPGAELLEIDDLGLDAATRSEFERILAEPQGLVILTGPTGSGKTTTLYSALSHVHRVRGGSTQIASVEDPIEIGLPFVSQTQVDRARNLDFSAALRALLRQDPNVLMVGEIRDAETAGIAVEAGLSGHLVLSSLHSESAAGVFARLIDMGTEPFLAASSTLACVSQRLVRRLCPDCRRPANLDRKSAALLAERGLVPGAGLGFSHAEGCRACEGRGVRGRTAVFELLRVTPELRRLVASGVPTQEIEAAAVEAGMKTLRRAAFELAVSGRIGVDELSRITG